jgi:4a-hydroxytetrahydrobiopterin dehydratase
MVREDIYELSLAQIIEKLEHFPGWEFENDKIKKEFQFKDFLDAFNFINKLVSFFEAKDHHPDIHIYYNRIVFELQRFDIGGKVTNMDFEVAAEIERLFAELQKVK